MARWLAPSLLVAMAAVLHCGSGDDAPAAPAADAGPDALGQDGSPADAGDGGDALDGATAPVACGDAGCGWGVTATVPDAGTTEEIFTLAREATGNVFVAFASGASGATVRFAGKDLTFPPGGSQIGLAKLGPDGKLLWTRTAGAGTFLRAPASAFTPAGDVVLVGSYGTTTSLGGDLFGGNGIAEGFVALYAGADGGHVASFSFGGPGTDRGQAVGVLSGGDIVVAGFCDVSAKFPGGVAVANVGGADACVARLRGSDLGTVWATSFGGSNTDNVTAMAIGPDDGIYVGGSFLSPSITFETARANGGPNGTADAFVVRLDPANGTPVWSSTASSPINDFVIALAVQKSGDLVVVGETSQLGSTVSSPVSFAGQTIGTCNEFFCGWAVTRKPSDGASGWSRFFGGQIGPVGACVESGGDLLVPALRTGPFDFGGPPAAGAAASGGFAMGRLSPTGDVVSAVVLGSPGSNSATHVACGPAPGWALGGYFTSDNLDIAGIPLRNGARGTSTRDAFVVGPTSLP